MQVYFEDIEQHIIDRSEKASTRLLVAMAWFSNLRIANKIISLSKRDIYIEILLDDNNINKENKAVVALAEANLEVHFIKNFTTSFSLMHNKFCVIDNHLVITGSYNWTNNANNNNENIVVFENEDEASLYSHEFRTIKSSAEPKKELNFDQPRYAEISTSITSHYLSIIRHAVSSRNFEKGSLSNFQNTAIENQIITVYQDSNVNIKKYLGSLSIYLGLIGEYGIEFKEKASPSELAAARDQFKRSGTKNQKLIIQEIFDQVKYKATQILVDRYAALLEQKCSTLTSEEQQNNVEIDRIIEVIDFLVKERQQTADRIGSVLGI